MRTYGKVERMVDEYELKVLQFYRGDANTGVIYGAALNVATERLISSGYLNRAGNVRLTPKATKALHDT